MKATIPTMAQPPRERELHPAAQAAAAEYSAVWTENDFLRAENQRLKNEAAVARKVDEEKSALISDLRDRLVATQERGDERVQKVEVHFRDRLARAKDRYLRYAVGIRERLKACREMITIADEEALEMAHAAEPHGAEIDEQVKDIVAGLTNEADKT